MNKKLLGMSVVAALSITTSAMAIQADSLTILNSTAIKTITVTCNNKNGVPLPQGQSVPLSYALLTALFGPNAICKFYSGSTAIGSATINIPNTQQAQIPVASPASGYNVNIVNSSGQQLHIPTGLHHAMKVTLS